MVMAGQRDIAISPKGPIFIPSASSTKQGPEGRSRFPGFRREGPTDGLIPLASIDRPGTIPGP